MDISNYIKDILYTHSQVNIPGFGAFIRTTNSAKVSDNQYVIQAPSTEISFDVTISNDDNVLTNYLVQNGQIKPDEAKGLIADYVSTLKAKLESGEKEEFNQIGTIHLDDEKQIIFAKEENSTFLPNTFALSELKVSPIKETEVVEEEKTKKPVWIWIAIVAAIIIILIMVFPVQDYMNKQKEIAASEQSDDDELDDEYLKENTFEETEENAETLENNIETEDVSNTELKFHIVAGSFGESANAENLKAALIKKGYSGANLLPKEGEWYRVSMASFANRKEAEDEMKKINSAKSEYEIWLFTVK